MKFNRFTEVVDKTTIELKESAPVAIHRLRQQSGICSQTDTDGCFLHFYCSKKGDFSVYNNGDSSYRIYYVRGEVFEEDGKTKVTVYTLHDRSTVFHRWVEIVIYLISIAFYVLFWFAGAIPEKSKLLTLIFPVVLIATLLLRTKNELKNASPDIEILKNEAIRRVEAIKRWND